GRSFDETQGRLTHDVALLMAGIRSPDNAAPLHRRNQLKANTVHYLFSVRNMFFLYLEGRLPIQSRIFREGRGRNGPEMRTEFENLARWSSSCSHKVPDFST